MKTWQVASAGLVLGVAATMGIGAIGHTDQPVGPYFQVTSQEIVNTSHVQTAHFLRMVEAAPHSPPRWVIQLSFENGKEEMVEFDTDDQAKAAWGKLQVLLGVEVIAPPGQ